MSIFTNCPMNDSLVDRMYGVDNILIHKQLSATAHVIQAWYSRRICYFFMWENWTICILNSLLNCHLNGDYGDNDLFTKLFFSIQHIDCHGKRLCLSILYILLYLIRKRLLKVNVPWMSKTNIACILFKVLWCL